MTVQGFSTTAGTGVAPSFVCEGGQLLFWPDTYDPKQEWDWTPFDAPAFTTAAIGFLRERRKAPRMMIRNYLPNQY